MKNYNIKSTVISDTVRVSSAGIVCNEMFGSFYLYETWIFHADNSKCRQFIHGTIPFKSENMEAFVARFHNRIVKVLIQQRGTTT
jgi:hypothetical protein